MAGKGSSHIGTLRFDTETLAPRIGNQCLDQLGCNPAPTDFGRDQRMVGHPHTAAQHPGQPPDRFRTRNMGVVFTALIIAMTGNADLVQRCLLA